MDDPASTRGIRIADPQADEWTLTTYPQLARLTRQAAGQLAAAGVRSGDTVVVGCPTSIDFVAYFHGALLLGATPAPVAPPTSFGDRGADAARVARAVRLLRAAALATTAPLAEFMTGALAGTDCPVLTADPRIAPRSEAAPPPEFALVQFSSGSTGAPKGVRLSRAAVWAQIAALVDWLGITGRDAFASWLPLHHDMGLIGMLLTPMSTGSDVWLMPPQQFIRTPLRWLRRFGQDGAAIAASPGFGLAHVRRRVRPEHLAGLDFSNWRTLVVGAEPLDAGALRAFAELLAPAGSRRGTVMPAYGMAEATLAVTMTAVGAGLRSTEVDPAALRLGEPVRPAEPTGGRTELVGCGRPLPGTTVTVVDEDGDPVADGVLGEVRVESPSLGHDWVTEEPGPIPRPHRTGDVGFLRDGHLYVLGRMGDGVKSNGCWISAEDIERLAVRSSPRPTQSVVVLGDLAGRSTAYVVVEGRLSDADAARVGGAVAGQHTGLDLVVADARAGWIEWTPSGKPRRRAAWHRIVSGELADRVRWRAEALTDARGGG